VAPHVNDLGAKIALVADQLPACLPALKLGATRRQENVEADLRVAHTQLGRCWPRSQSTARREIVWNLTASFEGACVRLVVHGHSLQKCALARRRIRYPDYKNKGESTVAAEGPSEAYIMSSGAVSQPLNSGS
jgi:hypothetical protein